MRSPVCWQENLPRQNGREAGDLSDPASSGDWPGTWTGRVGSGRAAGSFHNQESILVDRLFTGFWFGNDGRDDAYDRRDFVPSGFHGKKVFRNKPTPDRGFWLGERGIRHVPRLPHRFCGRAVYLTCPLDSTVNSLLERSSCRFTPQSPLASSLANDR